MSGLKWVRVGEGRYESKVPDGCVPRFRVVKQRPDEWAAFDRSRLTPLRHYAQFEYESFETFAEAKAWCEQQLAERDQ